MGMVSYEQYKANQRRARIRWCVEMFVITFGTLSFVGALAMAGFFL